MVTIEYVEPEITPPIPADAAAWLALWANDDGGFFGKGAALQPSGNWSSFEIQCEDRKGFDACLTEARAWAEANQVDTIWIQRTPTVERRYVSPDGQLVLIDCSIPDDVFWFEGSDWHWHGYLLAEEHGAGERPEQARARVLAAVLADEVAIVVGSRDGEPCIRLDRGCSGPDEDDGPGAYIRRWSR